MKELKEGTIVHRPWTLKETERLKDLATTGFTDEEIGEKLNRTKWSVMGKRKSEGIRKNASQRKEYVAYKGETLVAFGTIDEIAEETGYARNALLSAKYPSCRRKQTGNGIKLYELKDLNKEEL